MLGVFILKIKDNIILQYTLSTFAVVFIICGILGFSLTKLTADIQIRKHLDLYPEIVRQHILGNPSIVNYIKTPENVKPPNKITGLINDLKSFGSVFRVKIWDKNSTVLWSDDTRINGVKFLDDKYNYALNGNLAYEISKPDKPEQATETNHKQVLEIYIPAIYNGKVIGVVEVYEASDVLFSQLQKNIIFIWAIVVLSGIILYLLLFFIFYHSHKRLEKVTINLLKTQDVTILSLASLAETRSNETGAHLFRTQRYIKILAEYLKNKDNFKHYLNTEQINLLVKSSPLHDIGKVGIPDSILLKPSKLTPEEFEEMKKHTIYGKNALEIESIGSNSFLDTAKEIAYTHHEKWDGSGYPSGLRGNDIPISGRLMALADVYDALISKRCYKDAFTHENAKEIITKEKGTHFDPEIVEAFMVLEKEFYKISLGYTER